MKPWAMLRTASFSVRKNTYVKLLLSFIVLNILNIFVVFGWYYLRSEQMMEREIDQLSHRLLAQTQNISNYIYTSAVKGGYDLYYDESIYAAMFSGDELDVYGQSRLDTRMNRFIQMNPIIKSIYLYNLQLGVVISSAYPNMSVAQFPDKEMTAAVRQFQYTSPRIPYMLRDMNTGRSDDSRTLSLIVSEPSSIANRVLGAMIINIDSGQLKNLLAQMADDAASPLFIMQEDGAFVTLPESELFTDGRMKFRYADRIRQDGQAGGTFFQTIDGVKYVVAFQKTNLESTGFTYVSIYPYTALFKSLLQIRNLTLLSSAVLIAASLAASVFLSRNIYFPIRLLTQFAKRQSKEPADLSQGGDIETISRVFTTVIKENESLEQVTYRARRLLRDQLLRNLLLGHGENRQSLRRLTEEHNIELGKAGRVRVIVLRIDQFQRFLESYDSDSRYLIRYAMCNVAEETFPAGYKPAAVDIDSDHIAVLIDYSSQDGQALTAVLKEVQSNIRTYLKLGVTAGVGESVETLSEAAYSYEGAFSASHYRIFRGQGSILVHERLFPYSIADYPFEKEKAIMDELRLGRPQKMKEAVESLLNSLEDCPYRDLFAILTQLIVNLIKHIRALPGRTALAPELSYEGIYQQLVRMESSGEIRDWMVELFIRTAEEKNESKRSKTLDAVERGIRYIDENYQRMEFSVTDVADYLRYSASYLNKIFNEHAGVSVHEFINRKRIGKARELLGQSDLLINDIAGLAGFSSSNYFYYVFKKELGMTPSAYRHMNGNGD